MAEPPNLGGQPAAPRPGMPAPAPLPGRQARHTTSLTRRYEVAGLTAGGHPREFTAVAPASGAFEAAFGAFARDALVATAAGPVAVGDLVPGDLIETVESGAVALLWKGSMTLYPDLPDVEARAVALTRITADAFGLERPAGDLVLGPWARLAIRHPGICEAVDAEMAMAPASALADGVGVLALRPVTPVRLYHLGLDGQHTIRVCGIEAESFHPGDGAEMLMHRAELATFLDLFPHAERLADFGPMRRPRLSSSDYLSTRVA
mgnify:CR=1 FL=1